MVTTEAGLLAVLDERVTEFVAKREVVVGRTRSGAERLRFRDDVAGAEARGRSAPGLGPSHVAALGHAILESRGGFDTGDLVRTGSGVVPANPAITGLVCAPDPDLGKIATPCGSLLFLRLVGATEDEIEILEVLEVPTLISAMAQLTPEGVTDPDRTSGSTTPKNRRSCDYKLGLGV